MRKVLLTAVAVVAVAIAATGIATAAPHSKTDAQIIGNVQIDPTDPTVGYVTARYACQPGSPAIGAWGDATGTWVIVVPCFPEESA